MYNYVMLIGKIVDIIEGDTSNKTQILLEVKRNLELVEGKTDFILVDCYGCLSIMVREQFAKGEMVSLKGKIIVQDNQRLAIMADMFIKFSSKED